MKIQIKMPSGDIKSIFNPRWFVSEAVVCKASKTIVHIYPITLNKMGFTLWNQSLWQK